jgi:hypothetical protein
MDQMKDDSWNLLTSTLTWRDLNDQYLSALQHCERYCEANPSDRATNAIISTMGGLSAVYAGLRGVLTNPSRYDDPADQSMSNCVLALVRKIRREIPAVETKGGTA